MRATMACALLMLVPMTAAAQAYKCKLPNGKTSFQDQPCDPGAKGEAIILSDPSPPYEGPPKKAPAAPARDGKRPPAPEIKGDDLLKQRNRELEARNRTLSCNAARRDLNVLKTPRPVYRTGKNGEREFVEDANRDSEIQAAQQRVAESCK